MAVSLNRKWADRGGKSVFYVGVRITNMSHFLALAMSNAALRNVDSESFLEAFSSPVTIDRVASGLVSFR